MEIKRMTVDAAVSFVTTMIKGNYLSELTGISCTGLSRIKDGMLNSSRISLEKKLERVESIKQSIVRAAQELLNIKIENDDDVLGQLVEVRKKVCMPYVFMELMGKTRDWYESRMSKKVSCRKNGREYTMLGKFTFEDVRQINDAIRVIALTLLSIELVSDNPNNSETPTQSVDIESNVKDKSDHCIAEAISGTLSSAEGEVSHVDMKPLMPNDDFGDADLLLYEEMILAEMEQGD